MSERFYTNCPLAAGLAEINGPEAHHLARVCRLRPGDAVCLFNGDGFEYSATVETVQKNSVVLMVEPGEQRNRELKFHLQVAAPLPKGDRTQLLVEKLTEIGVTTLVPLRTQRSVIHPHDAKLEKLKRYAIEACKQCGRNTLPKIEPLTEWTAYCSQSSLPARRMLADPAGGPAAPYAEDTAIAVGPEGGFTAEEMKLALDNGWQMVGLGPRILRVETAAVALAAIVALSNPAWTAS
jgi:16S rRNA (uracil1498-N3)-methyltransferase